MVLYFQIHVTEKYSLGSLCRSGCCYVRFGFTLHCTICDSTICDKNSILWFIFLLAGWLMSILSLWFYILAFVHRNTMYRVPCTAATIRFVGWKIGSTTLLAKSCSCILSFWRGFNSLIRTIRIKLSSSSFQKSGLSPILSSEIRWCSPTTFDFWLLDHSPVKRQSSGQGLE